MKKTMFESLKQKGKKAGAVVVATLAPVAAFAGALGDAAATEIETGRGDAISAGTAMVGVVAVILVVGLIISLMRR